MRRYHRLLWYLFAAHLVGWLCLSVLFVGAAAANVAAGEAADGGWAEVALIAVFALAGALVQAFALYWLRGAVRG